jgi:PBP1b-binding outer membrane lipoprotein LpoB
MKKRLSFFLISLFALLLSSCSSCHNTASDTSSSSTSEIVYHTVTFRNYDFNVLQITSVEHGGTAVYTGEAPTPPSEDYMSYIWNGW